MTAHRVRRLTNPLSAVYQKNVEIPNWESIWNDLSRPIHLDIGCGKGGYLLELSKQNPGWNFLGTELRKPWVEHARSFEAQNLYYLHCNINLWIEALLNSFPQNQLKRISIQFPDPWVKKRHLKRRIVTPQLVEILTKYIPMETEVFVQSDVEAVFQSMFDLFGGQGGFKFSSVTGNPFGLESEWEKDALVGARPIWRGLFVRRGHDLISTQKHAIKAPPLGGLYESLF